MPHLKCAPSKRRRISRRSRAYMNTRVACRASHSPSTCPSTNQQLAHADVAYFISTMSGLSETVFEASLNEKGAIFKEIINGLFRAEMYEAVFECCHEGINIRCMDARQVSLIAAEFKSDSFSSYRCDRPFSLVYSLSFLSKLFNAMMDWNDSLRIESKDGDESLTFFFEDSKKRTIRELSKKP